MTASAGRRSGAEKLSDHLFDRVSEEILALPHGTASDVYVLSLNVVGDRAGAHGLRVEFGHNTETRWRRCAPEPGQEPGWPVASSPEEARWNYAFRLHDAYVTLLDEETSTRPAPVCCTPGSPRRGSTGPTRTGNSIGTRSKNAFGSCPSSRQNACATAA